MQLDFDKEKKNKGKEHMKRHSRPGVVVLPYNLSTWKAEAGKSQVWVQSGLHREPVKRKKRERGKKGRRNGGGE
jgi:hypothetical protein